MFDFFFFFVDLFRSFSAIGLGTRLLCDSVATEIELKIAVELDRQVIMEMD